MDSRKPETEILVHITAPSRASDDASYRTLADAYLSFEPSAKSSLGSLGYSTIQEEITGISPATGLPPPQPPVPSLGADPFASPELSFGSVAHNLNSPGLRRNPIGRAGDGNDSQSSWRAPPSVIEDSIPDNNISIARYSSPTRILEHYLQGFDSSQSNPSQSLPPADPTPSPTKLTDKTPLPVVSAGRTVAVPHQPRRSLAPSILVIPQTPSPYVSKRGAPLAPTEDISLITVATSPAPSQQAPPARRPEEAHSQGQSTLRAAETSIVPSSLPASTADVIPSSRADSEPPPPSKRQKRSLSGLSTNALARSSSDIGPRQHEAKKSQLAKRQRARQAADGLEIHSPEPPVGCDDLTISSIVTKKLEKLAKDVDIKKRFQPKEQRRELRPFERGYWSVDCSTWPDDMKRDAWGFLTNYVSNGDAGWGIWCRRDKDYNWIRLYCWGCAVGHMHLLLYLASRRELNYTGTTWIGGDGEVVVVLEPKYQRIEVG